MSEHTFPGSQGDISYRVWDNPAATHLIVIAHGYGEHVGRYEWVAGTLVASGAMVYAPDHLGHGKSAGEPVLVATFDDVDADMHSMVQLARNEHPDLPFVLVGHSMGGMIAARYAQQHRDELTALVLSGPVLGSWRSVTDLLELPEIPTDPLDTSTLSRDPQIGAIYEADPLVYHGPFKRETLRAFSAALATIDAGPQLGSLPTLWVHGADDQLVPIDETTAGIESLGFTDLTAVSYPGARHEVFNETNKSDVLAQVTTFIAQALAKRG